MSADGAAPRFEGSYMGAGAKISAAAVMECKICWGVYDPAEGDDNRQIPPGVAFRDLPGDWCCPNCGAPAEQFMVLSDPGVADAPAAPPAWIAPAVARLEDEFREIHATKMRDTPLVNRALSVQAVGFAAFGEDAVGVLLTPWFMNLFLLPGPDRDWSALRAGDKEIVTFPSGAYEFIHNARPSVGGYKACSLFSPMNDFASQQKALEVAAAVVPALLDARHAEPNPATEAAPAPEQPAPAQPTRRALLTGGAGAAR